MRCYHIELQNYFDLESIINPQSVNSILIFTSEYYGSANKIGSHYLAEEFAKCGIETYVISFPVSPLYRLKEDKTDFQARHALSTGWTQVNDNLYTFVPEVFLPPLPAIVKYVPWLLEHWSKQSVLLSNILLGKRFDIVLTESLFFNSLLSKLHIDKLVVRLPDNLSGFWQKNQPLLRAEQALIAKTDLVISPSEQLLEILEQKKINTLFLPNGVDLQEYASLLSQPEHYKGLSYKHHAVYVGSIQTWFDHELLIETSRRKPNWSFTIVGKKPANDTLQQYPSNVYFVGEKRNKEKVALLQHARVGIIPFETVKNRSLISTVNPIKLYEYLASGIDVVSTSWNELLRINAPIYYADDADNFARVLTHLENKPISAKDKKAFACRFAWNGIARRLLSYLNEEHVSSQC